MMIHANSATNSLYESFLALFPFNTQNFGYVMYIVLVLMVVAGLARKTQPQGLKTQMNDLVKVVV